MSAVDIVRGLLVQTANGYAEALTVAAAEIRAEPAVTWTSDDVADLLLGMAADTMVIGEESFGDLR